jgi:hypothetical protein
MWKSKRHSVNAKLVGAWEKPWAYPNHSSWEGIHAASDARSARKKEFRGIVLNLLCEPTISEFQAGPLVSLWLYVSFHCVDGFWLTRNCGSVYSVPKSRNGSTCNHLPAWTFKCTITLVSWLCPHSLSPWLPSNLQSGRLQYSTHQDNTESDHGGQSPSEFLVTKNCDYTST